MKKMIENGLYVYAKNMTSLSNGKNISELNKIILYILTILFSCIVNISNKSFYIKRRYIILSVF